MSKHPEFEEAIETPSNDFVLDAPLDPSKYLIRPCQQ